MHSESSLSRLVSLSSWKMVLSESLHSVLLLDGVLFWSISYFSSLLMKVVRYNTYRFRCLNLSKLFLFCIFSMSKICIVCLFTNLSVNGQISLCTVMQASWARVCSCRWWLCNLHSLVALILRPSDWNQSPQVIPHYILAKGDSLLRAVYSLNEQRIEDYAEAVTVKMRTGQLVSLGHLDGQLVVNFWLIKVFLQILSILIKLPEETTGLVGENVTYNAGRGGQWPSTVPPLQGSSFNVICIC